MTYTLHTWADRPDLVEKFYGFNDKNWPEFMFHDMTMNRLWKHLQADFAACQHVVCDEDGAVVAGGNAIPLFWDGTCEGLPPCGLDGTFERAVQGLADGVKPNTLCAVQASVDKSQRGKQLSGTILNGMREIAARQGLAEMIAPVRPTLKPSYPLTPMAQYVTWTDAAGLMFDPWLRTHQRLGATLLSVAERSMTICGTVAEWEQWAAMRFPESGRYVVAGALSPITIDRDQDQGCYLEDNVWMRHTVPGCSAR